jgi:type II secretory pathway pseudopilin PulG
VVVVMRGNAEPPLRSPTPSGRPLRDFVERHHAIIRVVEIVGSILLVIATLITLIFLWSQTEAARQQAKEAANQVSAARLDGLYQQLLEWDQFRSSSDNKHLNWLMVQGFDDFDDIKDPQEREQYYSALVWFLDYFSYMYSTLPGLLKCAPDDGQLIIRGSGEDTGKCESWVAWSQTIYEAFKDPLLCQVLNDYEELYEKDFVKAVRETRACLR